MAQSGNSMFNCANPPYSLKGVDSEKRNLTAVRLVAMARMGEIYFHEL